MKSPVPNVRVWFLALTGAVALLFVQMVHTQPKGSTYVVKEGDTFLSIAQQIAYPDVTVNQMGLALINANIEVFNMRSDVRPPVGTTLKVPDLGSAKAIDARTAQRDFNRLWRAEQHYVAGMKLEKSKDMFYAFNSYTEAAKLGHGLAQLRLGQLYDRDLSGFVQHDLLESVRWYERAREGKVAIPKQPGRGPRATSK